MLCKNCAKENAEGSIFCENCGTRLEPEATETDVVKTDDTPATDEISTPEEVDTTQTEDTGKQETDDASFIVAPHVEDSDAKESESETLETEESKTEETKTEETESEQSETEESKTEESETEESETEESETEESETDEKAVLRSELESVTEYEPITKKNKKKKVMIISGVVVAAIAIIAVSAYGIMNSGKRYLYSTMARSALHFASEAEKFQSGNKVLTDMDALLSNSYTQKISNGGIRVSVSDDKENKQISADLSIAGIPLAFNLYLTDTRLVVGSPMLTFLEADPADLGEDLANFADNNGLVELRGEITNMFEPYDFSYSKVSSGNILKAEPDREGLKQRYTTVFMNMVGKADYEKESKEIPMGEVQKKGEVLKLTLNREQLLDWLKNDLEPTVTDDKDLEDYLNSTTGVSARTELGRDPYGEILMEIKRAINYLENESGDCILEVNFSVYKNIISGISFSFVDNNVEKIYMNFSANGEANRLDQLSFDFITPDGDSVTITAKGNHIGNPVTTSDVSLVYRVPNQPSTTSALSFKWDTGSQTDNVTVHMEDLYGEKYDYTASFTTDGKTVKLSTTINEEPASWELMSIQDSPVLPENTMKIKDVTLDEILDSMGATGDLIRNYLMYGGLY